MGLKGMGVAPRGIDRENTGHHHLLVDTDLPPLANRSPTTENHIISAAGRPKHSWRAEPRAHTLADDPGRRQARPVRSARDLQADHHHRSSVAAENRPARSRATQGAPRVHRVELAIDAGLLGAPDAPSPWPAARLGSGPDARHHPAAISISAGRTMARPSKNPFKVWFGLRNMGVAPAGVKRRIPATIIC